MAKNIINLTNYDKGARVSYFPNEYRAGRGSIWASDVSLSTTDSIMTFDIPFAAGITSITNPVNAIIKCNRNNDRNTYVLESMEVSSASSDGNVLGGVRVWYSEDPNCETNINHSSWKEIAYWASLDKNGVMYSKKLDLGNPIKILDINKLFIRVWGNRKGQNYTEFGKIALLGYNAGKGNITTPNSKVVNGVIASVSFNKTSPVLAGESVTATVALQGTPTATGSYTVNLTSTKAGLSGNTKSTPSINGTAINTTHGFTFTMPSVDVDDFVLTFTFIAGYFSINTPTSININGVTASAYVNPTSATLNTEIKVTIKAQGTAIKSAIHKIGAKSSIANISPVTQAYRVIYGNKIDTTDTITFSMPEKNVTDLELINTITESRDMIVGVGETLRTYNETTKRWEVI